jgi:hypothetical protein
MSELVDIGNAYVALIRRASELAAKLRNPVATNQRKGGIRSAGQVQTVVATSCSPLRQLSISGVS